MAGDRLGNPSKRRKSPWFYVMEVDGRLWWGKAEIERLRRLAASGLTRVEISERMPGRTLPGVCHKMARLGIEAVRPHVRMTPAERKRLHELALAGLSVTRIAGEVGVPFGTVNERLRLDGVKAVNERVLKQRDRERLKHRAWIEAERGDGVEDP